MNPLQLTSFTQDPAAKASIVAEILPLLKAHSRIEYPDDDAGVLPIYIGGGVNAAENYLLRDVWPTTRVWTGDLYQSLGYRQPAYGLNYSGACAPSDFVVRRGRAAVTVTDAEGAALDPATYYLYASADPKTWGFQLSPIADLVGITVTAVLGFPTYSGMPDDLQLFILTAAAAAYEVRELANYGAAAQGVETASYIPAYLLDSWANLTYA